MKKILFICIFLIFGQISNAQYFKLNTNPENSGRQPDWKNEVGIILSKDSPTIIIGGANNKKSTGKLPAGVVVFANKKNLQASWVGICGNTIFTSWIPEGKIISSQEEYKKNCEEMNLVLSKLDKIEEEIKKIGERPNYNYESSLLELKILVQEAIKKDSEKKSSMPEEIKSGINWTLIIIIAIIVGTGAYLLSQKGNDNPHPVIIPEAGKPPGGSTGMAFSVRLGW